MNYSQNGFMRGCVENEALSASKMPSSFYAFYKISSGFEKELRRGHRKLEQVVLLQTFRLVYFSIYPYINPAVRK